MNCADCDLLIKYGISGRICKRCAEVMRRHAKTIAHGMAQKLDEMIYQAMSAPAWLGRGYFIPDMRPGGISIFRKLGDTSRPLARLAAAEREIESITQK